MTEQVPRARRPVLLIAVAAVAVAAAAAWLVWPGGSSGPTVLNAGAGPYSVRLSVEDPRLGSNSVAVDVSDTAGRPVTPDAVAVEPVMPLMGHALAPIPATADGPGHYRASGIVLPMSGQWEFTVSLRGPAGAAQAVFPLLVNN
jgi:hypothetical protein